MTRRNRLEKRLFRIRVWGRCWRRVTVALSALLITSVIALPATAVAQEKEQPVPASPGEAEMLGGPFKVGLPTDEKGNAFLPGVGTTKEDYARGLDQTSYVVKPKRGEISPVTAEATPKPKTEPPDPLSTSQSASDATLKLKDPKGGLQGRIALGPDGVTGYGIGTENQGTGVGVGVNKVDTDNPVVGLDVSKDGVKGRAGVVTNVPEGLGLYGLFEVETPGGTKLNVPVSNGEPGFGFEVPFDTGTEIPDMGPLKVVLEGSNKPNPDELRPDENSFKVSLKAGEKSKAVPRETEVVKETSSKSSDSADLGPVNDGPLSPLSVTPETSEKATNGQSTNVPAEQTALRLTPDAEEPGAPDTDSKGTAPAEPAMEEDLDAEGAPTGSSDDAATTDAKDLTGADAKDYEVDDSGINIDSLTEAPDTAAEAPVPSETPDAADTAAEQFAGERPGDFELDDSGFTLGPLTEAPAEATAPVTEAPVTEETVTPEATTPEAPVPAEDVPALTDVPDTNALTAEELVDAEVGDYELAEDITIDPLTEAPVDLPATPVDIPVPETPEALETPEAPVLEPLPPVTPALENLAPMVESPTLEPAPAPEPIAAPEPVADPEPTPVPEPEAPSFEPSTDLLESDTGDLGDLKLAEDIDLEPFSDSLTSDFGFSDFNDVSGLDFSDTGSFGLMSGPLF